MALYLIIVVVVLILAVNGLLWFLGQPSQYRRLAGDDLSKFFQTLLSSVYETGFLIIEASYDSLNKLLYEQGIDYETHTTRGGDAVVSFSSTSLNLRRRRESKSSLESDVTGSQHQRIAAPRGKRVRHCFPCACLPRMPPFAPANHVTRNGEGKRFMGPGGF